MKTDRMLLQSTLPNFALEGTNFNRRANSQLFKVNIPIKNEISIVKEEDVS
jgi:hypothetical protein